MIRFVRLFAALATPFLAWHAALAQVEGQWLPSGFMSTSRFDQVQLKLASGSVIAVGGSDNSGQYLASAEIYNPARRSWALTGSLAAGRGSFAGVLLHNGKVLVAGGLGTGGAVLASAELYNPTTGTWSSAGSLSLARYGLTANLLQDGRVLFAGGCAATGCSTISAAADIYNPLTNTWSTAGSLTVARGFPLAVTLRTGKVLAVGGLTPTGTTATTELYNPATRTWSAGPPTASIHYAGGLTLLPDGKVLATGGVVTKYPLNGADVYDPVTNSWIASGAMVSGRYGHTSTLLPDGTVFVAGGIGQVISCGKACTGFIPFARTEIFHEATGSFTSANPLDRALAYQTTTLTKTGQALTAGGEGFVATCCQIVPDAEYYTALTLSFSSYSLNFGLLQLGLASPAQSILVSNVSTHATTFASIAASGDYSQANTCPATLSAGQSCSIAVKFSPTKAGARAGAITLRDSDPGSPAQTIALTGTGETLALGFNPASIAFGTIVVGSTGVQTATLTNDGASPVAITGVSGVPANGFTQTNTCPATLGVQQSCTITLSFSPPDVFTYGATLSVANGAGAAATLKLVGTGADGGG
jgi:hypothetical protein